MEIIHHRNEWNWGKSVTCVTNDGYGISTVSFYKDDDTVLQAVISGVSVHNTHRRLGYGDILLNECEKEAKNNGFTEVSLWCVPNSMAYNWYKRKGYIETNETNESLIRLKKILK